MAPKKIEKEQDEVTASSNTACGSNQDPLVEEMLQQLSPEEMSLNQLIEGIDEKDEEIKKLEKQMVALKLEKAEMKKIFTEKNGPEREAQRKAKTKEASQNRKQKGAVDRATEITVSVKTNIVIDNSDKGATVKVTIQRGKSSGALKNAVLRILNKTAPKGKSDLISIKKQGNELYNFGPSKCGLRQLNTLGVHDGDELVFNYGTSQPPKPLSEADTLAQNIGINNDEEEAESEEMEIDPTDDGDV
ncbi:unnamed protein product [Effrenium voratum]|nr:unnamed protein product [Effrenium voratum]